MIHLSVQDIALLANLAGCCNSVDEFVQFASRTFGTDSALLSGQDMPAEFVVNYGGIDRINNTPTKHQFISAYNTISKLKNTQAGVAYKFSTTETVSNISVTDGKKLSDLATTIYGSIYNLKYGAVEYKAYVYMSIGFKTKRGPKACNYQTVQSIEHDTGTRGDLRGETYVTLSETGDIRSPLFVKGYSVITPALIAHNYKFSEFGNRIIDASSTYVSPASMSFTDRCEAATAALTQKTISHTDNTVDAGGEYTTVAELTQDRETSRVDPVKSVLTPKLIYHLDGTVDAGEHYTTIGELQLTREDSSSQHTGAGVSYVGIDVFDHTNKLAKVDSKTGYVTVSELGHISHGSSGVVTDRGVSYVGVDVIDHTNKLAKVDSKTGYVTVSELMLTRETSTGYTLGSSKSNTTLYSLGSYIPVNPAIQYSSLNQIQSSAEDNIAVDVRSISNITDYKYDDHVVVELLTIKYIQSSRPASVLVVDMQTLHQIQFDTIQDHLVFGLQTVYQLKNYRQHANLVGYVQALNKISFDRVDDHVVAYELAVNMIKDFRPGDHMVGSNQTLIGTDIKTVGDHLGQMYMTVAHAPRGLKSLSSMYNFTTVKSFAHENSPTTPRGDIINSHTTLSHFENGKTTGRSTGLQSVSRFRRAYDVHCDDDHWTWGDHEMLTIIEDYNQPVNTNGLSKIRVLLYPHPTFENILCYPTNSERRANARSCATGAAQRWPEASDFATDKSQGPPVSCSPNSNYKFWTEGALATLVNPDNPVSVTTYSSLSSRPLTPGFVALSHVRLYRYGDKEYSLSACGPLTCENLSSCKIFFEEHNCNMYSSIDKCHDQTRLYRGIHSGNLSAALLSADMGWPYVVMGEPMMFTIHLPEVVDVNRIDLSPFTIDGNPIFAPGWVHLQGYYPGCKDWFTISLDHVPRSVHADEYSDTLNRMTKYWRGDNYTSFSLIDPKAHRRLVPQTMDVLQDNPTFPGGLEYREILTYSRGKMLYSPCPNTTVMATSAMRLTEPLPDTGMGSLHSIAVPYAR